MFRSRPRCDHPVRGFTRLWAACNAVYAARCHMQSGQARSGGRPPTTDPDYGFREGGRHARLAHVSAEAPELEAVRQAVRGIMRRYDVDYWRRLDEHKQFPSEFFEAMAAAGYFGTLIPEAYGGSDAGAEVASVIVEEINRQGGDA